MNRVSLLDDKLLDENDAAPVIGATASFLQNDRLRKVHKIPYVRIGRRIRYRLSDLEAWVAAHTVSS
jgi:hypothetical protein